MLGFRVWVSKFDRPSIYTAQVRTNFKYITSRRAVGSTDPRRLPTLRQLLTYLDSQRPSEVALREAEQNAPKKIYRKSKRLIDGLYYDSNKIKRIQDFRTEFAKQFNTAEVVVATVAVHLHLSGCT
jgi:hypothetical protein